MTNRTIAALKQLAERPGTAHEGIVARGKLDAAKISHPHLFNVSTSMHSLYMRYGPPSNSTWTCMCGCILRSDDACRNWTKHEEMRQSTASRFKKGEHVYYNYWCYDLNCRATVLGMPRRTDRNWAWIRLKFDHLKIPRTVPIYSQKGCHLTLEPLDGKTAYHFAR